MVILAVSIAVSVVSQVSFRCFDGSVGFVPVFRWFRRFRLFRWFRSDGFVSVFRVLVHAVSTGLCVSALTYLNIVHSA